jgi:hypothetical protein
MITAAKGAAQVLSASIPRMTEKPDPAVATEGDAVLKMGMFRQGGVQRPLILLNERLSAVALMPVPAKVKNFPEGYQKSARFSAMIESSLHTSSSYHLDAKASRGRARIFYCHHQTGERTTNPIRTPRIPIATYPTCLSSPSHIP